MTEMSLAEVPQALGPAFVASHPDAAERVMEHRNLEVMGEIIHAIAAGSYREIAAHLAPDVTMEIAAPLAIPWVRNATGIDEVIAAVTHNFRTVRDQRPTPLALVAQGDTVMIMARENGVWASSGEPYEGMVAQQWAFRDHKLACIRSVAAFAPRPPSPGSKG